MEQRERLRRQTLSTKWYLFVAIPFAAFAKLVDTQPWTTIGLVLAGVIFLVGIALIARDYQSGAYRSEPPLYDAKDLGKPATWLWALVFVVLIIGVSVLITVLS